MTAEEYRKMLDMDFSDVELEELTDISGIQIDRKLPLEERKQQYLKKVGNPYLVRVGGASSFRSVRRGRNALPVLRRLGKPTPWKP